MICVFLIGYLVVEVGVMCHVGGNVQPSFVTSSNVDARLKAVKTLLLKQQIGTSPDFYFFKIIVI